MPHGARPGRSQLDEQRETFGFRVYGADQDREISAWLLPVALATTDIPGIAATLMDEFRRRRIVALVPTVIERLVTTVLVSAERHVTGQLTRGLSPRQTEALDSLLASDESAVMSVLAGHDSHREHRTKRLSESVGKGV